VADPSGSATGHLPRTHLVPRQFVPDRDRRARLGFDEAILCESKTDEQLRNILSDAERHEETLLMTRLDPGRASHLSPAFPGRIDYEEVSRTAFFGPISEPRGQASVVIVSAGSSDVPVCREAVRTLHYNGVSCDEVYDVGVAGLWRLTERAEELSRYTIAIAVAGMDAALPSVLAGLIPAFIVAVPTSTGYGVAEGGYTALKALLSSCAPGLVVVNIDNGYGAACAALRLGAAAVGRDGKRGARRG